MHASSPEPSPFQVVVRLRPVPSGARSTCLPSADIRTLTLCKDTAPVPIDPLSAYHFQFDRVFGPTTNQATFYAKCVHPLVAAVVQGVNAVVFCYGPSLSGRHYTLEGSFNTANDEGLIPRAVENLLAYSSEVMEDIQVHLKATYVHITANETIVDLADLPAGTIGKESTNVGGVSVTVCPLHDSQDIRQLLNGGQPTLQRLFDSRGHTVLTLTVIQSHDAAQMVSKLHLVRLAAPERSNEPPKEDSIRSQKAFAALSSVIAHVHKGSAHVPYRDARLTSLLRDSLTRNALGLFVCTLHPVAERFAESLRAAKYARRIKQLCVPSPGPFVGRFDQVSKHLLAGRQSPASDIDPRGPGPTAQPPPVPATQAQLTTQPAHQRYTEAIGPMASPPRNDAPPRLGGVPAMQEESPITVLEPGHPEMQEDMAASLSPVSTGSSTGPEPYPFAPRYYEEVEVSRDSDATGQALSSRELEDGAGVKLPPSSPLCTPPSPRGHGAPLHLYNELEADKCRGSLDQVLQEAAGNADWPAAVEGQLGTTLHRLGASVSVADQQAQEIQELRRTILIKEAEQKHWHGQHDALRGELIAARSALLATRAKRDEYFQQLEELRGRWQQECDRRRRSELEAEHWSSEFRRLESEQSEMRQTVVTAKHQMAHLNDQIQQLQVLNKAAQNALEAKTQEYSRLEEQLREGREQSARLQRQVADLNRQLVQLPDFSPLPEDSDVMLPLSPATGSPDLQVAALERHLRRAFEERDVLRQELAELSSTAQGNAPDARRLQVLQGHYNTVLDERRVLQRSLQACRRELMALHQEREALRQELSMAQRLDPPPTLPAGRVRQALADFQRLERELAVKALQLQEKHEEIQLLRLENSGLHLEIQHLLQSAAEVPHHMLEGEENLQQEAGSFRASDGQSLVKLEIEGAGSATLEKEQLQADKTDECINRLKSEVDELQSTVTNRDTQLGALKAELEACRLELRHRQQELQQRSSAGRCIGCGQEVPALHAQLTKMSHQLDAMTQERDVALRRCARLQQEIQLHHGGPDVKRIVLRAAHLCETLQALARMAGLPFPEGEAEVEDCRQFRVAFAAWLANHPSRSPDPRMLCTPSPWGGTQGPPVALHMDEIPIDPTLRCSPASSLPS